MKWLIVLIIGLVLIAGCAELTSVVRGVDATFIKNHPKSTLKVGEEFSVALDIKNMAGCDIVDGKVCISDTTLDTGNNGIEDNTCWGEVLKLDSDTPETTHEPTRVTFPNEYSYQSLSGGEKLSDEDIIVADVEYNCILDIGPQVCYAYDEGISECGEDSTISGGDLNTMPGPITVTNVEKILSRKTGRGVLIDFDITLKRLDKGDLWYTMDNEKKKDKLLMTVYYGTDPVSCTQLDGDSLYWWEGPETKKVINCDIMIYDTEGDFERRKLGIHLDYNYKERFSKRVVIVPSDTGPTAVT